MQVIVRAPEQYNRRKGIVESIKSLLSFPTQNSSLGLRFLNFRSKLDLESRVGPVWSNSAVMACIGWMQRNFPEARLEVNDQVDGDDQVRQRVNGHAMVKLVTTPNKYYASDSLWQGAIFDWVSNGNAYWYKAKDKAGEVRELWYIPQESIAPMPSTNPRELIGFYKLTIDPSKPKPIPVEDVIHFRFGFHPDDMRRGYTPLIAALNEIDTDNEGASYSQAIMKNTGVPGVILSPKDPTITVDDETRRDLESWWTGNFTGQNRGKPLIPNLPVDVNKIAFSPEEMGVKDLRMIPEDRICACLGIPAMVVNLTSGNIQKSFANYREAREAAVEQNLIPTQKVFGQTLDLSLLSEFEPQGTTRRTAWNYTDVRALQADQDRRWTRITNSVQAGLITVNEGRRLLGLPPIKGGDELAPLKPASQSSLNSNDGQLERPKPTLDRPRTDQHDQQN